MIEKNALIILPGWGGSHETWADFIALAQRDFNVVCIDLPCFGTEPCPTSVWGVEEYSNLVFDKIKDSKFQILNSRFILLGHSFGGQVAVKVASERPEIFSHLILIGAAVIRPSRKIRRFILGKLAQTGKFFFSFPMIEDYGAWFKKVFYAGIDARDYPRTVGLKREIFKKIIREDLSHLLPEIKIPTLVVWGTHDTYVPLRDGKKIANLLPNSSLKIIPKGKHGLHLQDPNGLLEIIRAYVQ
ncbi:MAG: alpha/beta hydrolase [Patescibacteria group bacterium]